jgi:hypothetical protein
MTDLCRIDVRSQGTDIELEVSAKLFGDNPQTYVRQAHDIIAADFDQLRAGTATPLFIAKVTERISNWLQDPDFDLPTVLRLGVAEESRSRIVFNVSRVRDEKMRYELSGFPIEMATPRGEIQPLSLQGRVSSIVHELAKVGRPSASAATGWPFKVLIVRAGPTDLAPVPEAAPIAEEILARRPELAAAGHIQIDVLSTEKPGGPFAGPPTREGLLTQLDNANALQKQYHMLVFLGHGDVLEIPGRSIPTGQLQFEDAGRQSDPFEANKVAEMLALYPVPVVLLIGCLTAAGLTPQQQQLFESVLPKWLRGNEGVAQTLINSRSGVQCAVGMRYRLDGADATLFLRNFFKNLLVPPAKHEAARLGDIELAVKTARHALHLVGKQPLSWAAPVVFRTLGTEPMFSFLATPPLLDGYEIEKADQASRLELWETLAKVNWSQRKVGEGGLYDRIQNMLGRFEEGIFGEARARAAVVMAERQEVGPGQLQPDPFGFRLQVPIVLQKGISVRRLKGTIVETTQGARIMNLALAAAIAAAGFELMLGELNKSVLKFEIKRSTRESGELPEGPLLTAEFAIGPAIETVYQINIESLRSEPPVELCGAANAIIVPAP